jgi:hypothetical protein
VSSRVGNFGISQVACSIRVLVVGQDLPLLICLLAALLAVNISPSAKIHPSSIQVP